MPPTAKPRRVPLLWILLPYSVGIGIARFVQLPTPPLLLAAAALGIACAFLSHKASRPSWHVSISISLILIGAARFLSAHISEPENISTIPREARLELRIKTLFNATDPATALGIATIAKAPSEQTELAGMELFFFLETDSLPTYPSEGETYAAIGVIRPLKGYADGDRFDAYLRNLEITHAYKQGYLLELTAGARGFAAFTKRAREHFAQTLSLNKIPESPLTGAYKGLMLGQKSELTPEQKQLFLANGTMHLFAISGLHIGVIALCFHQLLTLLRLKRGARAVTTLAAVALFVLVTGGSASSWRALLMVACFYLTSFGQKQASPINALVLSAFIYLLSLPGQLFQAGFQMSYFTVSAILMLGLPLGKTLNELLPLFSNIPHPVQSSIQRWLLVFKKWLLDALAVSTSAFLVSAMLGIYYFQILPNYGILINLFALPIASLAIVAGFLSLLLAPLSSWIPISELFNNAALLLIDMIHLLLEFTSSLPFSSIATAPVTAPWAATALITSLVAIGFTYAQTGTQGFRVWQLGCVTGCAAWIVALMLVGR